MRYLLGLIIILAALWLLLSGYFNKPLLLWLGAASVVVTVYLSHRLKVIDGEGVPVQMFPKVFGYWFWLFVEIGKANIIVAREAFAVTPDLSPKLIRSPMTQKTDAGRATFANSITLTPGTVSVDLVDCEILVHALTEELADEAAIAEMGEKVTAMEGSV